MKLWKDNRTDQLYHRPYHELATEFWASKWPENLGHWRLDRCLRAFLVSTLNSVFDENEYNTLLTIVGADISWYFKKQQSISDQAKQILEGNDANI